MVSLSARGRILDIDVDMNGRPTKPDSGMIGGDYKNKEKGGELRLGKRRIGRGSIN